MTVGRFVAAGGLLAVAAVAIHGSHRALTRRPPDGTSSTARALAAPDDETPSPALQRRERVPRHDRARQAIVALAAAGSSDRLAPDRRVAAAEGYLERMWLTDEERALQYMASLNAVKTRLTETAFGCAQGGAPGSTVLFNLHVSRRGDALSVETTGFHVQDGAPVSAEFRRCVDAHLPGREVATLRAGKGDQLVETFDVGWPVRLGPPR